MGCSAVEAAGKEHQDGTRRQLSDSTGPCIVSGSNGFFCKVPNAVRRCRHPPFYNLCRRKMSPKSWEVILNIYFEINKDNK